MNLKELLLAYDKLGNHGAVEKRSGRSAKAWLLNRSEDELLVAYLSNVGNNGGMSLRVYQDGYVLYVAGTHYTVFHLDETRKLDIAYETADPQNMSKISKEAFQETPWYIALSMMAMDRIALNCEKQERKHVDCHITDDMENLPWMGRTVDFTERQRQAELKRRIQRFVKQEHWNVFCLLFFEQMPQKEVAAMLGVTQQAVSKIYQGTLRKLAAHQDEFADFKDE